MSAGGMFVHSTPRGGNVARKAARRRKLLPNPELNDSRIEMEPFASIPCWTPQQNALFCDALADGASIAGASLAAGKTKGAGISKLRKIVRALGVQAQ